MKNSWTKTFRRLAAGAVIAGTTAMSSAMCYAQVAYDTAADPVYNGGWAAGQNAGFGFGPWDFTGTYNTAVGQTMDGPIEQPPLGTPPATPFNDLGRAWTLYNADGPNNGVDNPPSGGTDISQAGREILGGLKVGQTFCVTIDNPTERGFFRGYTVRLNTGGGNTVYAGVPQTRMAVGTFEYFTNGQWYSTDGAPTLKDVDTDTGMEILVTLTGPDTFNLVMDVLNTPGPDYTDTGTLSGPAGSLIDWVEFEFYNTDSDWNPSAVAAGGAATDFYIREMCIVPEPATAALFVLGGGLLLGAGTARRRKE